MNERMRVAPYLAKARDDLDDAMQALGVTWTSDDHDSIARLTNAGEALTRSIASVAQAVERLAELVVSE